MWHVAFCVCVFFSVIFWISSDSTDTSGSSDSGKNMWHYDSSDSKNSSENRHIIDSIISIDSSESRNNKDINVIKEKVTGVMVWQ